MLESNVLHIIIDNINVDYIMNVNIKSLKKYISIK